MNMATTPKDDLLGEIWSISTTLTEEAMALALTKANEAGFDIDRGVVTLQESFNNLSSARSILEDAIEKRKLVQLPITVQKEVLANLQNISKSLLALAGGSDEIVNLTNAIESLNASIWKYGLHNLSDQVLGYQKKLNQLKNQELQISKMLAQLDAAKAVALDVNNAATETEHKKTEAAALLEQVKQSAASSSSLLEQVKDTGTKSAALFATIQQNEKQTGELTASMKTANNELIALDGSIRKFYSEADEYRRKIIQTTDDASKLITTSEATIKKLAEDMTAKTDDALESAKTTSGVVREQLASNIEAKLLEQNESFAALQSATKAAIASYQADADGKLTSALGEFGTSSSKVLTETTEKVAELEAQLTNRSDETIGANQKKTDDLISDLVKLKDQIREQIQQATGFQLFGAFQSRQNEIAKSKNIWVYAIATLVVISAGVTVWIAHEAQFYNANSFAFWVKLSLTVPLGYAITFCTVQYGRERRLEEEYAFKSSVSVSLNPYRDMVLSILEKDGNLDQSKYTDFVISSVMNVFTPPTDKVFDTEKKSGFTQKTFKQTAEIIGTAVKAAK